VGSVCAEWKLNILRHQLCSFVLVIHFLLSLKCTWSSGSSTLSLSNSIAIEETLDKNQAQGLESVIVPTETPVNTQTIPVPPSLIKVEAMAEEKKYEKKSKLQLKLEALAKEKERLDRERDVREAAEAVLVAEAAAREVVRKIAAVAEEQRLEEIRRATEIDIDEDDEGLKVAASTATDFVPATMFGDEVVQEYSSIPMGGTAVTALEQATLSGKKLSNKDKRRLAKAAEDKEREDEENRAAMKASIEGAQFAVCLRPSLA
jgi:hypothetical protein